MGIHDGHREHMRKRYLAGGLDPFADHEALELLLYYAIPRRDVNPIAHALMERYGSLLPCIVVHIFFNGVSFLPYYELPASGFILVYLAAIAAALLTRVRLLLRCGSPTSVG